MSMRLDQSLDQEFAAAAVRLGLLDGATLARARAERNRLEQQGVHSSVRQILIRAGVLTPEATAEIEEELGVTFVDTDPVPAPSPEPEPELPNGFDRMVLLEPEFPEAASATPASQTAEPDALPPVAPTLDPVEPPPPPASETPAAETPLPLAPEPPAVSISLASPEPAPALPPILPVLPATVLPEKDPDGALPEPESATLFRLVRRGLLAVSLLFLVTCAGVAYLPEMWPFRSLFPRQTGNNELAWDWNEWSVEHLGGSPFDLWPRPGTLYIPRLDRDRLLVPVEPTDRRKRNN